MHVLLQKKFHRTIYQENRYKMLPYKTLASKNEAAASGYKKSKQRVTVSLCSNATGIHKLPLILISKSTKPRAFKNVNMKSLPVYYHSSRTAWKNQELFKEWFHYQFVPSVKVFTIKKFAW